MSRAKRIKSDPDEVLNVSLTRREADLLHGKLLRALRGDCAGVYSIHFVDPGAGEPIVVSHESCDRESRAHQFGQRFMDLLVSLLTTKGGDA